MLIIRRSGLKAFLVFGAILLICMNTYAYIYHNGSGSGYENIEAGGIDIENHIVEGAAYFLDGYSNVLILLKGIETSDINGLAYDDMLSLVNTALADLNNAKTEYDILITEAEKRPYKEAVIGALTSFNYTSFRESNSLNSSILIEVEIYLKNGDITGALKRSRERFNILTNLLNSIKYELIQGKAPSINSLWRLNNEYANECLFGQYSAQVFAALKL